MVVWMLPHLMHLTSILSFPRIMVPQILKLGSLHSLYCARVGVFVFYCVGVGGGGGVFSSSSFGGSVGDGWWGWRLCIRACDEGGC